MKRLEKAKIYYLRSPQLTDVTIRKFLTDNRNALIHGSRAINAQLPSFLERPAEDWDIFVSNDPKAVANQLEQLLDARYDGNYFKVVPAKHSGTYRIVSLVTKRPVADITLPESPIPSKTLDSINVATLDYHVNHIKETLADPKARFRHNRDRETLQRINIHKEEQRDLPTDLSGLST